MLARARSGPLLGGHRVLSRRDEHQAFLSLIDLSSGFLLRFPIVFICVASAYEGFLATRNMASRGRELGC